MPRDHSDLEPYMVIGHTTMGRGITLQTEVMAKSSVQAGRLATKYHKKDWPKYKVILVCNRHLLRAMADYLVESPIESFVTPPGYLKSYGK